jgi:glutamate synthase domain-containing protein 3
LADFESELAKFVMVMPNDYRRVLEAASVSADIDLAHA